MMLQSTKSVISLQTSGDHRCQSLRLDVEQFEPIYSFRPKMPKSQRGSVTAGQLEIWTGQNLIMGLQSHAYGIRLDITFLNTEKKK